nr:Fusaric acid resistance protein family protein [Candidatus Pantoea persica]
MTPAADDDYRQRAFCQSLRDFCWIYLNVSRWIRLIESAEAGWSALRTFAVIVTGCAFWIATQWSSGAAALPLTAIACVLNSSAPSPSGSVSLLLKTLLWLSLFSFVMKFGLMVQISQLWQFLLFLFPLLTTLQLFELQQKPRAALWGAVYRLYGILYFGDQSALLGLRRFSQRQPRQNLRRHAGVARFSAAALGRSAAELFAYCLAAARLPARLAGAATRSN